MNTTIKRCSTFSAGLVLLLGSSMATAAQDAQNQDTQITGNDLLCEYTKVDYTGRPPFKRTTVKGECLERADFARFEDTSRSTSKKKRRIYGHPSTWKH